MADAALPARPATNGAWRWPALIVGMLVAHVAVCGVLVSIALSDPTGGVEPNYYQQAVNWDAAAAERRASEALGWRAALDVDAADPAGAVVTLKLSDRAGQPVTDARVDVLAFHHARSRDRYTAILAERSAGVYAARMPVRRTGRWEFRLCARRGADKFVSVEMPWVSAGGSQPR